MNRFFYDETLLKPGTSISLSKEEYHHARSVMRVKDGDSIEIINGKGSLAVGKFGNKKVHIETSALTKPPQHKKILIQALTAFPNLQLVIEKCSEIGITDFFLFPSTKSKIDQISASKQGRLDKILIASIKQCKRLFKPVIHLFSSIDQIKIMPQTLYLAERSGKPCSIVDKGDGDRGIIVGPESGFTSSEIQKFCENFRAIPVNLSENVLRSETASILSTQFIV